MIVRQETFLTLYTLNEWYSVINGENMYETVRWHCPCNHRIPDFIYMANRHLFDKQPAL